MKNIKIVIGSNFGDEGKGLATDYFAGEAIKKDESCIVVCSNGGAQKGHTITTPEGLRHVTHHFGSGVLVGADTYLSSDFIINPIIFRQEREELINKGIKPNKVYVNYNCMVTTPYDMLVNQIIEEYRGNSKHGSCGLGIFETIKRNEFDGEENHYLHMGRVNKIDIKQILLNIRSIYLPKRLRELGVNDIPDNLSHIVNSDMLIYNFLKDIKYFTDNSIITPYDDILTKFDTVIFECSQGLLLDQNNKKYFPYLTPSNTGVENPMKIYLNICDKTKTKDIEICYITRTYMTKHGAGSFNYECDKLDISKDIVDLTNVPNPFQDTIRYGKLDLELLLQTIRNDLNKVTDNIGYKSSIMLTHINETNNQIITTKGNRNINDYNMPEIFKSGFNIYLSDGETRNQVKIIR